MVSQFLMSAEEQFRNNITAALHKVPFTNLNQPLYHFTDDVGLGGILRTRSLWASLATALDDTSEIKYALERAKLVLHHCKVNNDSSFLDEIVSLLDQENSRIIDILGMKTYIVSFRINVDESAHWKTYGRAGKGFAIAFALKPLIIPGILPLPVLYDPVAQDKLLQDFSETNIKLYSNLLAECPREDFLAFRQRAVQFTALGLWTLAPVLKDSTFRSENEWRLIVVDLERVQVQYGEGLSSEVRIRRSNNRDIPYKVLGYDALPIVGLTLGPYADIADNNKELKKLLRDATSGFDVPITRSQVLVGHAID